MQVQAGKLWILQKTNKFKQDEGNVGWIESKKKKNNKTENNSFD